MMNTFEVIQAAEKLLAQRTLTASDKTKLDYLALSRAIIRRAAASPDKRGIETLLYEITKTNKKNTLHKRRAALLCVHGARMRKLLDDHVALHGAFTADCIEGVCDLCEKLKSIAHDINTLMQTMRAIQNQGDRAIDFENRHSKRSDLKRIQQGWRETLYRHCTQDQDAFLVEAATGCRPAELVKGVRLWIEDGLVIAEIKGAKVTAYSGQPVRRLGWSCDSESLLIKLLTQKVRNGMTFVHIGCPKAYSSRIVAAGRRVWPKRKATVSPYCLRHAAASDMKASGMDPAAISAALGHCASGSRSRYGAYQMGSKRGGVAPAFVWASRQVRERHNEQYAPSENQSDKPAF